MTVSDDLKAESTDRFSTENIGIFNTGASQTAFSRAIVLAMLLGLAHGSLHAQPAGAPAPEDTSVGGTSRPGSDLPELPQPGEPTTAPLEVPEAAPAPEEKAVPYGVKVFIKEIHLTGNTVFSVDDLQEIITPYVNRVVSSSELEDLRVALTRHYIEHGYINSGAVLHDQKVIDGTINIAIVEGRLTDIEIIGNDHLNSAYVKDRLELGIGPPLNVNDLQEQIQIILDSPVIQTLNSALRPGDRPGEATLTTQVNEGPRFQLTPVIDNRLSPSLGDARLLLPLYLYDPTGYGDVLSAGVGLSEGLTDSYLNWSVPLNTHDTTLSLSASRSDGEVVNGSFKDIDVNNKTETVGFRVSHPFYRTPSQKFSMALGLDLRSSQSKLLGVGFPFTAGVPADGKVQVSVVRFSQDWTKRGPEQVLAARSQFSFGIDTHDATINQGNIPSGEFSTWLGQFQWANLLGNDLGQIIFRTNVQLTNDPLFSMEQFSVGGALSVRGYRENQIVRDNGYNLSLEYRYPLMKDAAGRSILVLVPFFDAGGAHNTALANPDPDFISSAGIGLRWDPTLKIHAQVYWGHAFHDVLVDGDSLQDDGIHFLLSANLLEWM